MKKDRKYGSVIKCKFCDALIHHTIYCRVVVYDQYKNPAYIRDDYYCNYNHMIRYIQNGET
jgi:hypothetical protein